MISLSNMLSHVSLGASIDFRNLALFPLFGGHGGTGYHRDYLTLGRAVAAGTARVSEVSQGGSVPELVLENTGKEPVLLFEGEELRGAKQNRTANVTILVAPGSTVRVPVTCVEQGRWRYDSRHFTPSQQVHFASGRSAKLASVSRSMQQAMSRRANQTEVWDAIGAKSGRMRVASPTSAMSDVFEAHRPRIEEYVDAFASTPDQVGAIFAIDDRIEGLELFDCAETHAEMLPKLVRSYAIDAIETADRSEGKGKQPPTLEAAAGFLERVRRVEFETYEAIGLGTETRISLPELIAAGLVHDGRIVHLAAFATTQIVGGEQPESGGLARMRSRRGSMRR